MKQQGSGEHFPLLGQTEAFTEIRHLVLTCNYSITLSQSLQFQICPNTYEDWMSNYFQELYDAWSASLKTDDRAGKSWSI